MSALFLRYAAKLTLRLDAGFASLTKFETYVAAQGSSPVLLTLESEAKLETGSLIQELIELVKILVLLHTFKI